MTVKIHPTAIVDLKAELDSSVEVGPYSIIGPNVKIDAGTRVAGHVTISDHTIIGKNNQIFQYSSLGEAPQDKKFKGEPTLLEIGDNNTIREFCTFNRGTIQDRGETTNLAPQQPEVVSRMTRALLGWHQSLPSDNGQSLGSQKPKGKGKGIKK